MELKTPSERDDLQQRQAQWAVLGVIGRSRVFGAIAVLKGALQVEALTGMSRSTRDIDLTLSELPYSLDEAGRLLLKQHLEDALRKGLPMAAPTGEWSLYAVSVKKAPPGKLPGRFGHDGFSAKATLERRRSAQHVVSIDFSWGDLVGLPIGLSFNGTRLALAQGADATFIRAYSPEEQIAEKLRAFLQKLPAHLNKIGRPHDQLPRYKDICDVANLVRTSAELDWTQVAAGFKQKCLMRRVDCCSVDDFVALPAGLPGIELGYNAEGLGAILAFGDAWAEFRGAIGRVASVGGLPGLTPLPDAAGLDR